MPEYRDLRFPEGFLWGAASSAHQVEGNCTKNDWWELEQSEAPVLRGAKSGIACDHYSRFEDDFALARSLGHNSHRLSIEWSRIEPEEGRWDMEEVAHYRRVLKSLHSNGLTPIVTVHHFTNPQWVSKQGGWLNPKIVEWISRYSRFIAFELRDLASFWTTMNEPMVIVVFGYGLGLFPPGLREWEDAVAAARHMLTAHGRVYEAIHEATGPDSVVALVHAMPYVAPADPNLEKDREAARQGDLIINEYFLAGIDTGTIGPPFGQGEIVPGLKGSWDAIGVNYYTRNLVTASDDPHPMSLRGRTPVGAEMTMMGYEVYPEGLYHDIVRVAKYGKPIYVTENGISTLDEDQRNRHLLRHLQQAHRAIEEGADVRGYLYWSLMDNFEWTFGYKQKFGMCAVEPETLQRVPKPAAYLLRDVAVANSVSGKQQRQVLG